MSVPYSHDFHSNQIGVAVAFNETKHSFYKYYYMNDKDNEWMQRTAYHPVGISGKFKDDKTPNCLAISANIGNAHRTGILKSTLLNFSVQLISYIILCFDWLFITFHLKYFSREYQNRKLFEKRDSSQ